MGRPPTSLSRAPTVRTPWYRSLPPLIPWVSRSRSAEDPPAIAIAPDGKTAYVPNYQSGTVTPISTVTNTAGKPIKVGTGPIAIAFTPDGKTAYVVCLGADTVIPISTATNTPGTPIKVGIHPYAIAITP